MLTIILNPASGAGRKADLARQLGELFHAAGQETRIREIVSLDEVPDLVHAAIEQKHSAFVSAGGDGTASAIAALLAGGPLPLGVLPLGTFNHFAKDLRIPLDLPAAVRVVAAGHRQRIDVGRVNDRLFLNNSSIGVYPSILEERDRLRANGYRKWPAFALATLEVLRRGDDISVRLEVDGAEMTTRTPFVFIGNNEYQMEGIHLGARTRLDVGRLFAYVAAPIPPRELPRLLARALAGRVRRDRALETFPAAELWVETPSDRQIKVACDGELLTMTPPLHYRAWPGALNVIVPSR